FYFIFDIIVTELDISEISDAEYARTYQGKGVLVGYDVRKASIKINNSRSDFTVGEILLNLPDTSVKSQLHNNLIEVDGKTWIKTGKAGYIDNLGRLWYTGDYANTVKVDEKEIFIFAVEESVNANPYVAKAAFVVNNNTRVLYVELTNPRHVSHTEEIKLEANNNFGCNIVQQIKVGKIPMSKHNPMHIDYQKIIKG
ncbi:MAG: hypothetical protein J0G32_02415, partial [Alphaproteobacteria bacterium]|nr:hypothetical protein [Alphaproteobacteria bacterium]